MKRGTTWPILRAGLFEIVPALVLASLLAACTSTDSDSESPTVDSGRGVGKSGSMARFRVVGDQLYALSGNALHVYGIADPAAIAFQNSVDVGPGIETLFARGGFLYIGSQTGMFVYDIADRTLPVRAAQISHFRSCDPVVVEGRLAFVTLRSGGSRCWGGNNELQIFDVADPYSPIKLKTYPMANPHGVGVDGDRLFLCDGYAGLKVYRLGTDQSLILTERVDGLETYDVIPDAGASRAKARKLLVLIAKEGLYQYDYGQSPMKQLSRIEIAP